MIPAVLDGVSAANEMSQIRAEINDDYDDFHIFQMNSNPAWRPILSAEDDIVEQQPVIVKKKKKKVPTVFWFENYSFYYPYYWNEHSLLDPVFIKQITEMNIQKQNILRNKKKRELKNIE